MQSKPTPSYISIFLKHYLILIQIPRGNRGQ